MTCIVTKDDECAPTTGEDTGVHGGRPGASTGPPEEPGLEWTWDILSLELVPAGVGTGVVSGGTWLTAETTIANPSSPVSD